MNIYEIIGIVVGKIFEYRIAKVDGKDAADKFSPCTKMLTQDVEIGFTNDVEEFSGRRVVVKVEDNAFTINIDADNSYIAYNNEKHLKSPLIMPFTSATFKSEFNSFIRIIAASFTAD